MISAFTPPGIKVVALKSGAEVVAGRTYTVRAFVINRHWKTREPDPHVLFEEVAHPSGRRGEIGYPREAFDIPNLPINVRMLESIA